LFQVSRPPANQFPFATIEDARPLHTALLRIGNLCSPFGDAMFSPRAAAASSFLPAFGARAQWRVEPFARAHNAVLRFVIRDRRFQAFFDQSISEQAVAELGSFECPPDNFAPPSENVHAFFISKLRQSFRVHFGPRRFSSASSA